MAFPRYMYSDPARVWEDKADKSCRGCQHEQFIWKIPTCALNKKHSASGGKKCKDYGRKI